MKKYSAILMTALTLGAVSAGRGQENGTAARPEQTRPAAIAKFGMEAIEKAYAHDLDSDVDGIVNSALANVASIAITMPEEELSLFKDKVATLVEEGRTPETRYRALLASMAFSSPGLFTVMRSIPPTDESEFFATISAVLDQSLIGQQIIH